MAAASNCGFSTVPFSGTISGVRMSQLKDSPANGTSATVFRLTDCP